MNKKKSELLAIKSDFERFDEWIEAFQEFDIDVIDWDEIGDKTEVDYALVWKPEPGSLAALSNLKVVFSVGAGLDHLKGENLLPPNIPVVRMVESGLTAGMVEYVVYHVLRFHRFMPSYEQQQQSKTWNGILQIPAAQRTVGILGLGELGNACAQQLLSLGFNVSGWSRSEKSIEGVACYHSMDQLDEMLSQCDFLVCLLPHTSETEGILAKPLFKKLRKDTCLINAGRGKLQIESDILEALDNGELAHAVLDVFETEPLASDSLLWDHPKVTITPHVASMTLPATSAIHVYDNIERHRRGEQMTHIADMSRGY